MLNQIKQKLISNLEIILIVFILLIQTGLYINLSRKVTVLEEVLLPQLASSEIALENAPDINLDGEYLRGNKDSKITIVEFGDYECPFCALLHPIIEQILDEYEGNVRFVFKDYPLEIHPHAMQAAEAVHCAGTQGKYWEMHDLLFSKQYDLSYESLIQYGSELELNIEQYKSCIDTNQFANDIQLDLLEGEKYQIAGTPVIYMNGRLVDDWTVNSLRDHIETLINDVE